MAKLAENVYGDALFSLGLEKGTLTALYDEVVFVQQTLAQQSELMIFLCHPKISSQEKETVLCQVFSKETVSDGMRGFLVIVLRKGRQAHLPAMLDYFIARYKEYQGMGIVQVTTPMPLSPAQEKAMEKRLLETTKYQSLEMHYQVDASLIGGAVIRIGDRVVDSSIKTRLMHLSRELKNIQLQ